MVSLVLKNMLARMVVLFSQYFSLACWVLKYLKIFIDGGFWAMLPAKYSLFTHGDGIQYKKEFNPFK